MTSTKFRYIGTTDECVECQKCGKADLKATVVLAILDADGNDEEITYYGSTCAARALAVKGGGRAVLQSARWAHEKTIAAAQDARNMLRHYGLPLAGDIDALTLEGAAAKYAAAHPRFCGPMTNAEVAARVMDMVGRKRAALAEAELIGAAA